MQSSKFDTKPLTGLRIVAAWLVFLHHFNASNNLFQQQLYVGVTLFFVLSGFFIAHRYYVQADGSKQYLKSYFLQRFWRIYPLLLVVTCLTFIVKLYKNEFSITEFLLNLTLLKGFSETYKFSGVPQTWSLTVELCFYGFAPFLFYLRQQKKWFWRWLLAFWGVGLCLILLTDEPTFVLFYTFFGRCFEFWIGAWLFISGGVAPYCRISPSCSLVRRSKTYIGTFLLIICLSGLYFEDVYNLDEQCLGFAAVELLINNFLLPISVVVLIAGLMTEQTLISKILITPLFQLLGKSSYAFFLIHLGILSKLHIWLPLWLYFLVVSCFAVLIEQVYVKTMSSIRSWPYSRFTF